MVKLEFSGRASKDGEIRKAGDYEIGTCGVAITVPEGKDKNGVLFLNLSSFGAVGKRIAAIRKGDQVWAVCTGKTRSWDDKSGKKQYSTEWAPVAMQVQASEGRSVPSAAPKVEVKEEDDASDDVPF